MDSDEREIVLYLRSCPGQFISAREIARRASGKRRAKQEPNWAAPILARLVDKKVIESDSTGHYRLVPRVEQGKRKRWISPKMKQILEKSGKDFSGVIQVDEPDDLFSQ